MFVCLSVCWYVEGLWNPNPCTNPNETLQAHLHLSKEGFGVSLTLQSYHCTFLNFYNTPWEVRH